MCEYCQLFLQPVDIYPIINIIQHYRYIITMYKKEIQGGLY